MKTLVILLILLTSPSYAQEVVIEKPTLTIVMPCLTVEKMTFGFPPVAMMTTMFFQRVEFINSTNMLPVIFNPVCN